MALPLVAGYISRRIIIGTMGERWFKEKWQTQSGDKDTGGERKTFRPTVRVSSETPTTWSELTPAEKEKASEEKKEKGRVSRFRIKKNPKK